ncbi:MAG: hypothetical protein Q9160_000777 [Pyrenula sp. 1 TL-2023]
MSSDEDRTYQPEDAIANSVQALAITGAAGLFVSAIQNSLARQNVSAWGVLTRTGGTAALFASMGGAYGFVKTASANLREKHDPYNNALGGFFAGALVGLRSRSMPAVLGRGAALATIVGVFEYTGGQVMPTGKDPEVDEFDRKEALKKRYRRPVEETINEIGEGRGIYGPGYEERRRQRIKDAYGIDVPPPFYKTS